jgi:hypothetical protein
MQENETTKRLAAYAALIAVPTMIAGLYGMNFENMPELRWNMGYPVALLIMVIDVYLFRFRARPVAVSADWRSSSSARRVYGPFRRDGVMPGETSHASIAP